MVISTIPLTLTKASATDIAYPYTFVNGQILPAGQLNGNFAAVQTVVDGGLTNGNISASAAIALSKLDLTSQALMLRAAGNPTWASGVTGDTVARITMTSDGFLQFGAGSASATDIMIKRLSSTQLGVRNTADNADEDLKCANLTASTALKLVNTNTMTLTPAALGANRAITVVDPGAAANLVFSTGTLNANGVIYSDGTNFLATATGGSGVKFLTSTAGAAPVFSTFTGGFGGNGGDGAVAPSGITNLTVYNATTFSIANGVTFTPASGFVVNCTSTATIGGGASGTIAVRGAMPGGSGGSSTVLPSLGNGPFGGPADQTLRAGNGFGGAGGSNGSSAGGHGGGQAAPCVYPATGAPSGAVALIGSGGGGGTQGGGTSGGNGGYGGGVFTICAVGAISVAASATIDATGGAGSAGSGANAGGGGGGSGGAVILASQASVTNAGIVTVAGGVGGAGATSGGGGGGGAGGTIIFWAPSITAGTRTTTAGGAGANGTTAASAGTAGTAISITGTPSLPLLSWIEDNPDKLALISPNTNNREVAALAAGNDLALFWQYRSGSLTETCETIGDVDTLGDAA